jgi:hypothetical protein
LFPSAEEATELKTELAAASVFVIQVEPELVEVKIDRPLGNTSPLGATAVIWVPSAEMAREDQSSWGNGFVFQPVLALVRV